MTSHQLHHSLNFPTSYPPPLPNPHPCHMAFPFSFSSSLIPFLLLHPYLLYNSSMIFLGLGFNIVGGTDQQYVSNDSGIFVSRIKENGAAALDGRLQEGDKILSVNGQDLKNLLHRDAVDLFRNAGYAVSLRVQHRLQVQNGPLGHHGEGEPSGIPITVVLVPVFALIMVAAWAFMRYRQRL
ncbi:synaptojanin-2-binding protein isoform X2 [Monodon monoceros]|uniref:synaptojanin-2-binding protein isoform X2 n=1 Tax=Monodon monoceros TaxID=40151 RepID=UPI0010F66280|nr:synaptojanin-2-binding protein isoform X2 [Monodon monoceros]